MQAKNCQRFWVPKAKRTGTGTDPLHLDSGKEGEPVSWKLEGRRGTWDGNTRHQKLAGLAISFSTGILLQLLGCILWQNYWPLLTALMYVLVPMPWLFFGQSDSGSSSIYGGSSLASGWIDAGKFLTGFSAVGSIAIPAILFHSEKITAGALGFELAAVAVFAMTILAYDYFSSRESGYY